MRLRRYSLFIGTLALLSLVFSSNEGSAENGTKTLSRWTDPVAIEGRLMKEMLGKPISNLRVYAYQNGKFEPIRYQIDEMTGENGDWIFPEGPIPNGELGNGKLDPWDVLFFMVSDLGDKAPKDIWVSGYTKGNEIEITDPVDGGKGWCYLLYFASNPPSKSSLPDYITYDYKSESQDTEYFHIECMITPDGRHSTFYTNWYVTEKAGGNGENFVDRVKIRPRIKLLFGSLTLNFTEELIKSNVIAYKRGPVSETRRVEQYTEWHGIRLTRMIADVIGYRNMYTCPIIAQFPFKLNTIVSSFAVRFATDYSPNVLGSKIRLSGDPDKWYLVDGKMDESEKNFNPDTPDKWKTLTGEWGSLIYQAVFPKEVMQHIRIKRGIIDDTSTPDPPETYPGCIGMAYQDWYLENIPRGTYYFFLNWYFPINYKPGDEVQYMNYRDYPVKIQIGDVQGVNHTDFAPVPGKKYK